MSVFKSIAKAEEAAYNGQGGSEWDSQNCRDYQAEILSVGVNRHHHHHRAAAAGIANLAFNFRAVQHHHANNNRTRLARPSRISTSIPQLPTTRRRFRISQTITARTERTSYSCFHRDGQRKKLVLKPIPNPTSNSSSKYLQ